MTPIRIDDWSVIDRNPNAFLRLPECAILCLHGTVTGHPKHPDGTVLPTSPIRSRDGDRVVTASGNVYVLGTVHPDYEAKVPNARARLLAVLAQAEGTVRT